MTADNPASRRRRAASRTATRLAYGVLLAIIVAAALILVTVHGGR